MRGPGWTSLLALGLLVLPRAAGALEPGRRFDQYAHAAWPSVAHASAVYAVLPARDGHLWVGTSEGLARFDGQRLSTFDAGRLPGLAQGQVLGLLETAGGTLWVATGDRISRVAGARVTSFPGPASPAWEPVVALLEDPDGTIWVGGKGGLRRLLPEAQEFRPAAEGLPDPCTHALVVAGEQVWAGTHRGLARWSGQSWAPVPVAGLASVSVDALVADPDGTLWVGTGSAGLWQLRAGRWRNFTAADGLGTNDVATARRDRDGHLWVATHGTREASHAGTLAWLDGERFRTFPLPPQMCADRIEALAEDGEGGLWIATESCGLHRLSDRPFRNLTTADGLPTDRVLGMAALPGGGVVVGTRGEGLARLGPDGSVERLACAPGLPCHECWDFSPARTPGGFWTVCAVNQVLGFDGQRVTRVALPGGLSGASFALEARDGARWFALDKKVVRAQGGVVESLAAQERFEGYRILFEGRGGAVWIAADDGLARWQAGQTRIVRLPPGDRPAEVHSFLEDAGGALWMATKGEGIRHLEGDRITTIGVAEGLPTGWIVQLLEDGQGRLWASSSKGIFWVDKRELEEVVRGQRRRVAPGLYDAGDGIQMHVVSFGHPAGIKDERGRLWFATNGGLTVVDPTITRPAPRVVVEEVRLDGQRLALAPGQGPVATGGPRDLEVKVSALTFAAPDTVSYRYKLREGDRAWVELGPSRLIQQARLEPGRYQLAVAARTRDGGWSEPTRVEFTLRPAFHRSPLFLVVLAAAAALLLLLLHRARLARTRARMEAVVAERTRIAREIHDTLAQAFVATSVQLECLEEALEGDPQRAGDRTTKIRRHLDTAKRVVEESLDEARRAVWVLRPQAVEPGLVPALETLVRRLSGGTALALAVEGAPRDLPPLVASNLLRIAHEAVANAHRHARARRIDLRVAFAPRSVTLSVDDDGQGMPAGSAPGPSQGILGMRERAAQIGGALSIEARPERGTTVRVEVAA